MHDDSPDPSTDVDTFTPFVARRRKDLQRIARHTRGELQLDDVISEAWLLALTAADGAPLDLSDPANEQRLLSHLYQQLVRYTELNVRHAVRLDHAPPGSEHADDPHPLATLLVADEGRDPLRALLEREASTREEDAVDAHGSLAAAYVRLLRRFDHRMGAVARHLMISTSYAYRRCAQAREWTTRMLHIPVPVTAGADTDGPWRRFRLTRVPEQLVFDFDEALPLTEAA